LDFGQKKSSLDLIEDTTRSDFADYSFPATRLPIFFLFFLLLHQTPRANVYFASSPSPDAKGERGSLIRYSSTGKGVGCDKLLITSKYNTCTYLLAGFSNQRLRHSKIIKL
jgi:hypothetical protein